MLDPVARVESFGAVAVVAILANAVRSFVATTIPTTAIATSACALPSKFQSLCIIPGPNAVGVPFPVNPTLAAGLCGEESNK